MNEACKTEKINDTENTAKIAETCEIVGVRFKKTNKVYYFDANGMKIDANAHVIVETVRGLEYGTVVIPNKIVSSADGEVIPSRCVLRVATEADEKHYIENAELEKNAFNICLEKIAHHGLAMKLTEAEYTFDNTKLLFYFTADGRVDFRELVKDLASVFHTRIELRQIGIRDEAKMLGGIAVCGRPYCCHNHLCEFEQVSIKMAKEQNLSLNSSKVSGSCGRLMCCLRYEYDDYAKALSRMPRVDAIVDTVDGEGVVVEINPLEETLKVHLRSDDKDAAPRLYGADSIKRIKGYIKSDKKEEIDEELIALEKE